MEVLFYWNLKYLNLRINKDFYDSKKCTNAIEAKICESMLRLDIYIFENFESN